VGRGDVKNVQQPKEKAKTVPDAAVDPKNNKSKLN
jgi:hypothetical protein